MPAVKHHGMHYYSCVEKKNIFAKGNMGLLVKVKFNTLINYNNYKNNLFRDNLATNHSYLILTCIGFVGLIMVVRVYTV